MPIDPSQPHHHPGPIHAPSNGVGTSLGASAIYRFPPRHPLSDLANHSTSSLLRDPSHPHHHPGPIHAPSNGVGTSLGASAIYRFPPRRLLSDLANHLLYTHKH